MYFLEVGLVLIVVPWSQFWDRNFFVEGLPFLQAFVEDHFVRGAISGVGVVNVCVGLVDFVALLSARHRDSGLAAGLSVTPREMARRSDSAGA